MIPRAQPPAYTPISVKTVVSGVLGWIEDRRTLRERAWRALSQRYAVRDHVWTDSGTSALTLALAAAAGEDGETVVLPAYGCYDLATAAVGASVPIRMYDLDPRTLGPRGESLRRAVRGETAALVVANLHGIPLDWELIRSAVEDTGTLVVEDAAQASGCTYGSRRAGETGDLAVLSFGRGKGIGGVGGGVLMANTRRGQDALNSVRDVLDAPSLGIVDAIVGLGQLLFSHPNAYWLPASLPLLHLGATLYHEPWRPARPSPVVFGTLGQAWDLAENEVGIRRAHAGSLRNAAEGSPDLTAVRPPSGTPGYLRFPLLADDSAKLRLESANARSLGVMPGYPQPLTELDPIRDRIIDGSGRFPGAVRLARDLYTLPTHSRLSVNDLRVLSRLLEPIPPAGESTAPSGPGQNPAAASFAGDRWRRERW